MVALEPEELFELVDHEQQVLARPSASPRRVDQPERSAAELRRTLCGAAQSPVQTPQQCAERIGAGAHLRDLPGCARNGNRSNLPASPIFRLRRP